MDILTFNCPIFILQMYQHEILKPSILNKIECMQTSISRVENGHEVSDLQKTDWYMESSIKREYFDIVSPFLSTVLQEAMTMLNFNDWSYSNFWFQQYGRNNNHIWHRHPETTMNCVYYVELPNGTPQTLFRDPLNNNNVFTVNAKEGDIVLFPSMLEHCSPPNQSDCRKTVIVANIK